MRWLRKEDGAAPSTTVLGSAAAMAVVLALVASTTPDVGEVVVDGIRQAITQEGGGVAMPADETDSGPAVGTDTGRIGASVDPVLPEGPAPEAAAPAPQPLPPADLAPQAAPPGDPTLPAPSSGDPTLQASTPGDPTLQAPSSGDPTLQAVPPGSPTARSDAAPGSPSGSDDVLALAVPGEASPSAAAVARSGDPGAGELARNLMGAATLPLQPELAEAGVAPFTLTAAAEPVGVLDQALLAPDGTPGTGTAALAAFMAAPDLDVANLSVPGLLGADDTSRFGAFGGPGDWFAQSDAGFLDVFGSPQFANAADAGWLDAQYATLLDGDAGGGSDRPFQSLQDRYGGVLVAGPMELAGEVLAADSGGPGTLDTSTLLAQASGDQRVPVSERQRQFNEWHRATFGFDPRATTGFEPAGDSRLTPEQQQQVNAKRAELGLAPDWGFFTMTDQAFDLWFDRVPEEGIFTAVPDAALGYTLSGIGPSIGILGGQIGLAGALAAQSTSVPRDLVGQTALNARLFEDPVANYLGSMGVIGATQLTTDFLGRQVQAATGFGLTPMGQRLIGEATTLGERERFIQYVLNNGGRSGNRLSNFRLDTGNLAPYVFGAGALVVGGNEFIIPHVDNWLSPDLQRTEDGTPIFANDAEWLAFYGPRAFNVGAGVATPFTGRCIARGGSARECATVGAMTIGLPAAQTLAANAVTNPPEQGFVRDVGVPVGEFLGNTVEGAQDLWRGWTSDNPAAMNPWTRIGGVPVNLGIAAWDAVSDVTGQIMAPPDPERIARGELTGIFTPEAQQRIGDSLQRANQTIRTYGPVGETIADGLAGAGQTAQGVWDGTVRALDETNRGFWRGAEQAGQQVLDTLWNFPGQTARVITEDVPQAFGNAAQQFGQAAQQNWDRFTRIVTGQPVEPLYPFAPRETPQPIRGMGGDLMDAARNALNTNAPIPGLSGPCNDPSCPNWGRFAGTRENPNAPIPGLSGPCNDPSCPNWGRFAGTQPPPDPNAPIPGLSGPCNDPSCPNWGRLQGPRTVGEGRVGPCERGMPCWGQLQGERRVGPLIVGPGGPYTEQEQNWLDLQNNVIRGGYEFVDNVIRNPVGAGAAVLDMMAPTVPAPQPQNQSLPSRAGEALQNSVDRIRNEGLPGVGGVLRDGWNCVTRPRACIQGPQSSLPGNEVLVASLPGTDLALDVAALQAPTGVTGGADVNLGTGSPDVGTGSLSFSGDGHQAFQPDLPGTTQWQDYTFAPSAPPLPTFDTAPLDTSALALNDAITSGDISFGAPADLGGGFTFDPPPASFSTPPLTFDTGSAFSFDSGSSFNFDSGTTFDLATSPLTFDTSAFSFDGGSTLGASSLGSFDVGSGSLGTSTAFDFDSGFSFSNSFG